MVGTIGPLVKVAPRRWLVSVLLFVSGSAFGGAIVGIAVSGMGLVLLGSAPLPTFRPLLVSALLVSAAVDLLGWRIPTIHRSVPQHWWLRWGPLPASAAYGVVLGMGITTFVPVATFYALLLAIFLSGPLGPAIGLTYGLARALPVLAASAVIIGTEDDRGLGTWLVQHRMALRRVPLFAVVFVLALSGTT